MDETNIVSRLHIPNPLEYIDITAKKKIDPKTKQLKKHRYYLTANLFYGGVHSRVRMHIVAQVKNFLKPYIGTISQLANPPYSIVLQYCRPQHIDVSNVCFFWDKIICDMLAPPAPKKKKIGKYIIPPANNTDRKLPNDNSNYIDCVGYEYYCTDESYLVVMVVKN